MFVLGYSNVESSLNVEDEPRKVRATLRHAAA